MRTILSTWSKFSLFLTIMEQDANLRSQVIQATDLLLKAVERLEGRPASPSVSRAMSGPSDSLSICRPSVSRAMSGPSDSLSICSPYRASTSEMNKLFNWTATKRRPPEGSRRKNNKKKKLQMWTHNFCCLARKMQRYGIE